MLSGETIPFRNVELTDKSWIDKRLAESDYNGCEYCFGNIYVWGEIYQFKVVDFLDFLIIKTVMGGKVVHYYPAGSGDIKKVIQELVKEGLRTGHPLVFGNITQQHAKELNDLFPGAFTYKEIRDASDYIYSREKLSTLAGKRYHGKRNHINRFKDNPNWSFEIINQDNLRECFEMSIAWNKIFFDNLNSSGEISEDSDFRASTLFLSNYEALGLEGGLLRQNGKVIAFTIGERLNLDTYVIHIEKAFRDVQGAYPMINQQFTQQLPEDIKYINREEDLGIESLRYSKMSYHPEILLTKYQATFQKL